MKWIFSIITNWIHDCIGLKHKDKNTFDDNGHLSLNTDPNAPYGPKSFIIKFPFDVKSVLKDASITLLKVRD